MAATRSSSRSRSRSRPRASSSGRKPSRSNSKSTPAKSTSKQPKIVSSSYVLDEATKSRLALWKYHSGTYTPVDVQMNKFWESCVTFLPLWLAPNLVTLLGSLLVLSTTFLMVYHDPLFLGICPSPYILLGAAGHFTYMTLDAIDGKQARRTSTSSPLGQLFDHGCDAFITNIVGLMCNVCLGYGSGGWSVGNVILNFNVFFLAQWEEYHTGTLNTNNGYFGLTEGQLAQIATMISCAVDRGMWSLVVPGFGMEAKYVLLVPMTVITCSLAVQSTIRVLFTTRQSKIPKADYGVKEFDRFTAVLQLVPQYSMYAIGIWLTSSDLYKTLPVPIFMLWGTSCTFYTTQIIVSQMSKSQIDYFGPLTTVVGPMFLAAAFFNGVYDFGKARVTEGHVLGLWAVVLLAQYAYFVSGVCLDLSSHLGIKVFTIPYKK
ncbi:hypothetical protein TrST_g5551 [Triparma strigata]|uniref:Uncharacterized protein n=1 Tax=Triparma strigata TaxID=1606541 RepID=A0A9W7B8S9_9STRA|nr:hypothetical protein TrST_g5551 [Triparma strigata]